MIRHGGEWRQVSADEFLWMQLPDGTESIVTVLGRDCEPDIPGYELDAEQCRSLLFLARTFDNDPLQTVAFVDGQYEPSDFEQGRTSMMCGRLTDPDDPESGILAFGLYPPEEDDTVRFQMIEIVIRGIEIWDRDYCATRRCANALER